MSIILSTVDVGTTPPLLRTAARQPPSLLPDSRHPAGAGHPTTSTCTQCEQTNKQTNKTSTQIKRPRFPLMCLHLTQQTAGADSSHPQVNNTAVRPEPWHHAPDPSHAQQVHGLRAGPKGASRIMKRTTCTHACVIHTHAHTLYV